MPGGSRVVAAPKLGTKESTMKKLLLGLVVAFAAFYLFTQPVGAADAIKGAAAAVGDGFEALIRFLTALFS